MASEIISRSAAKANRQPQYYTGKPCKHGHIAPRRTVNGTCIDCVRLSEARDRDRHRERHREKWKRASARQRAINPEKPKRNNKKWERENPERVRAKKIRYRTKNLEKVKIAEKRWRDANPDKIAKKNRRYKTEHAERLAPINRERVKTWARANPDAVRKNVNTRRARKQNAPGSHTTSEIVALLERQNFKCTACGTDIRVERHLDHKQPLSRGGSNDIANLQWLCPSCNCSKHDKDLSVWARERGISL